MASPSVSLDPARDLLECPVCLDVYKDPRILPCHHTFCTKPCLKNLINSSNNTLLCPLCRTRHLVPEAGISEYSRNSELLSLLNLSTGNSVTGENDKNRCIACQATGVSLCDHCSKMICCVCEKRHVEDFRGDANQLLLQVRSETQVLLDRLSHVDGTNQNLQKQANELKEKKNCAISRIVSMLQKRCNTINNTLDAIAEFAQKTNEQVLIERENILSYLAHSDEWEEKLSYDAGSHSLADLQSVRAKMLTIMETIRKCQVSEANFDLYRLAMDKSIDMLNNEIEQLSNINIADAKCSVVHTMEEATSLFENLRVQQSNTEQVQKQHLVQDGQSSNENQSCVQEKLLKTHIERKEETAMCLSSPVENLAEVKQVQKQHLAQDGQISNENQSCVQEKLSKTHIERKDETAMCLSSPVENLAEVKQVQKQHLAQDGQISNENQSCVQDKLLKRHIEGKEETTICKGHSSTRSYCRIGDMKMFRGACGSQWDQFIGVYGVASSPDGSIIATDNRNHRVKIFDSNMVNGPVHVFGSPGNKVGEFDCPFGVATMLNGDVVVADGRNHRVQIFSMDGTCKKCFGSEGSKTGQFKFPQGICVDSKGRIFICDAHNARVCVYDENGKFLRKITGGSKSGSRIGMPRYVAVDKCGHVYVCDMQYKNIKVYDDGGNYLKTLGRDPIQIISNPRGVATDDNCNVIVAEHDKHVLIFNDNGKLINSFKTESRREEGYITDVCVTNNGDIVVCGEHRLELY